MQSATDISPDSLVSSQVYEIIKTIYSTPDSSTSPETRISVLQNTLGQLRLANIATLDALTTHFTRLIELTSAEEDYVATLANHLAPCILRPRTDTALTLNEKHSYRLIRDLFAHKESIFGELKRASALSHTPSGGKLSDPARSRAISTDESNRRANMEARNRAIASKSRNSSPAPHANGRAHRRDKSMDPPLTRFPIQTSPTGPDPRRGPKHISLEVPADSSSTVVDRGTSSNGVPSSQAIPEHVSTGSTHTPTPPPPPQTSSSYTGTTGAAATAEDTNGAAAPITQPSYAADRRDSQTRMSTRFPPRRTGGHGSLALNRMSSGTNPRDSVGSDLGERSGVQLSDKPMDD